MRPLSLAPSGVELEHAVHPLGDVGAAPGERFANQLGFAADQSEVKHEWVTRDRAKLVGRGRPTSRRSPDR